MKSRILLLVVVALGCSFLAPGPGTTVERFVHAVERGDLDVAAGLVEATSRAQVGDKLSQLLAVWRGEMQEKGGLSTVVIDNETVAGDRATVKVTLRFGNGTSESDDMKLRREKEGWRIVLEK